MALRQSVQIAQNLPSISADGFEPIAIVGDYVTVAGLAANDVIEMGILQAGYVPTGIKLVTDDADTGAAMTLDCGIITGKPGDTVAVRTCGTEAFAGSTIGQTGGLAMDTNGALALLAPSTVDRSFGLKIGVSPTTLIVGAKIRLTMYARPQLNGA